MQARAGETVALGVAVASNADLSALFAKIPGVADFFQAPLVANGGKRFANGKLDTAASRAPQRSAT